MPESIDLCDGWEFTWTEHQGRLDEPHAPFHVPWRDAVVPGDVHLDLMRNGLLPDLYVGRNLDRALWMENKDWWYRRSFETPQVGDDRIRLVFHGLDCFATVWLNGELVGRSDNMFVRHEIDITDKLLVARPNELIVRLASPRYSVSVDPDHHPVTWSPERFFCRKAQMSFGWDIAPRLVTVGIWRPVELQRVGGIEIEDTRVVTESIDNGTVRGRVELRVARFGPPCTVTFSGQVLDEEWQTTARLEPGCKVLTREIELDDPPLWWPVGYGEPGLVDVSVAVETDAGDADSAEFRTGFRTIELVQEPQPSGATSFRFRVNGRDLFITGLNWTPLDAVFARVTPEKITRMLERLAALGCNMLRVWGGGIYESPHFYDECDRLGILIWQDFMMACGWYPQTDEMAAAFEAEARQMVRDLRRHPCIGLWAGDNECDAFAPELAPQNRLTRVVLREVCEELHPEVPYLPSSPYSPESDDPQDPTEGDVHHYAHGEDYRRSKMWGLRPRFISEFGHLSLPSAELIRRYFPPGTEWPLDSPMWRYHGTDMIETGRFRWTDCVLRSLAATGRPGPPDLGSAVAASQELQAEAIVALIERYCEDPEFAGFMVWNVGDCWPQMSDSVFDYDERPKLIVDRLRPLFERVRRAWDQRHT